MGSAYVTLWRREKQVRKLIDEYFRFTDQVFDDLMLKLHDKGVLTLQTAMTIPGAFEGINTNNRTYAYCLLEDE